MNNKIKMSDTSDRQKELQYVHVMEVLLQRDSTTSVIAMSLELHFGKNTKTYRDVDKIMALSEQDMSSLY